MVVVRMKGFHDGKNIVDRLILNGRHKSRDVFVVVVKGTADDPGFLYNIGYGYFVQLLFLQKQKKGVVDGFVGDVVSLVRYFLKHLASPYSGALRAAFTGTKAL